MKPQCLSRGTEGVGEGVILPQLAKTRVVHTAHFKSVSFCVLNVDLSQVRI